MARSRKTRTTFTDGFESHTLSRARQQRQQVAAEAARIMATGGQRNYRAAKQKAAERVGVRARSGLPSNKEIEVALRAYQGFYGGAAHSEHLEVLRATALKVMRALESFCPRLVGPVLEGTADQNSRISLHVFHDPPDEVVMHIADRGLKYTVEQRKIRWHDGGHRDIALLVTDADGINVELALFGSLDLRQAPPSPIDGRPQRRAPVSEVECLLAGV